MINREALTLGEIIKKDMQERGIKATVVAKKMNISRQSINQIDKRKKFDLEFLTDFAKASGLDYTKYATENTVSLLNEPDVEYKAGNRITLALNISCSRNRIRDFNAFLNEIEDIAQQYGYQFV